MNPIRLSYAFGAADTVINDYLPGHAPSSFAHAFKVNVPDFTNAVTATLNVYDADGDLVFTKSGIAKNQVTMVYPQVGESKPCPISGRVKTDVTLSGAPGGSGGTVAVIAFPV